MDAWKTNKPNKPNHMENRVSTLEAKMEMLAAKANDLEARLRGIEKSVWKSTGALALFQALLTIGLAVAIKLIK